MANLADLGSPTGSSMTRIPTLQPSSKTGAAVSPAGPDGARKIWRHLNRQGHPVARCTVERLIRELGPVDVEIGRAFDTATMPELAARRLLDIFDHIRPHPIGAAIARGEQWVLILHADSGEGRNLPETAAVAGTGFEQYEAPARSKLEANASANPTTSAPSTPCPPPHHSPPPSGNLEQPAPAEGQPHTWRRAAPGVGAALRHARPGPPTAMSVVVRGRPGPKRGTWIRSTTGSN
jgi:HTH-like domain